MTDRPAPPTYREWVRTPRGVAALAFAVLVLLYSLVVAQQLLLGVWFLLVVTVGVWALLLLARFVHAFERLVVAVERIAAQREADGDPDGSD